jgi:hypothetical protein
MYDKSLPTGALVVENQLLIFIMRVAVAYLPI